MVIISYKFCLKIFTLMIQIELDHINIICAQTTCLGRIRKAEEEKTQYENVNSLGGPHVIPGATSPYRLEMSRNQDA